MVRVQINMHVDSVRYFDNLAERLGIATRKQFFNVALSVLDTLIKEMRSGHKIVSIDETTGKQKELIFPFVVPVDKNEISEEWPMKATSEKIPA